MQKKNQLELFSKKTIDSIARANTNPKKTKKEEIKVYRSILDDLWSYSNDISLKVDRCNKGIKFTSIGKKKE